MKERNLFKGWFLFFSKHPVYYSLFFLGAVFLLALIIYGLGATALANFIYQGWPKLVIASAVHLFFAYWLISRYITRPETRRLFSRPKSDDAFLIIKTKKYVSQLDEAIWEKPRSCVVTLIDTSEASFDVDLSILEHISGVKISIPFTIKANIYSGYRDREEIAQMIFSNDEKVTRHMAKSSNHFFFRMDWFFKVFINKFTKDKTQELFKLGRLFAKKRLVKKVCKINSFPCLILRRVFYQI